MKKKLFIIIFLFFQCNFLNAEQNIFYVDIDKVLSMSKTGSSILKQLNELNNQNNETIKNEEEKLKSKEKKILSQKNIISDQEFQIEVEKLKLDVNKYNNNRSDMIKDFNQLKLDNTNRLLKLIDPILQSYSEKNSISMILQKKNLIIGKIELDITNDIIKIVDKEIKEFKIN